MSFQPGPCRGCFVARNKRTMKTLFATIAIVLFTFSGQAQSRFPKHELSINGFRNPSIGLEYRHYNVSVHAGYYLTALDGVTTNFWKAGTTLWFARVGKKENPSSFYAQFSYLRGINADYKGVNAGSVDAGFRWSIWKGLNLRIGALALLAADKDVMVNPTGGLSYSLTF